MKKISWRKSKGGRAFEHIKEGYVDGKLAFMIEGRLCVTDLRKSKESLETDTYIHPKHYKLDYSKDRETILKEAKTICSDLLNGLNLDIHEANYQKGEEESRKTAQIIKETQEFLDSLKEKENENK